MPENEDGTKPWIEAVHKMPLDGPDYRWVGPAQECLCGCDLFVILGTFEGGEIAGYFLDVKCVHCGATLKAPTMTEDEDADVC